MFSWRHGVWLAITAVLLCWVAAVSMLRSPAAVVAHWAANVGRPHARLRLSSALPQDDADADTIDVAIAADESHLPGVAGVINSALAHTSRANTVRFHVIVPAGRIDSASARLRCLGVAMNTTVALVELPDDWLRDKVRVVADPRITGKLASPLNFARFYLAALLPRVNRLVYLDSDVIVNGDITELWRVKLPAGMAVAAVPRAEAHFRYSRYAKTCSDLFATRHGRRLNGSLPTFNAGVLLVDLSRWRSLQLTQDAEWWLAQHRASPSGLWSLGSQPALHLVLYGRWATLPNGWNLDALGRLGHLHERQLSAAKLLHWTGRRKPWTAQGLYVDRWRRYVRWEHNACARM
jgi:lipopolysaccharide biosynthesis glycosyltransferase